jgi:hypothetical protein
LTYRLPTFLKNVKKDAQERFLQLHSLAEIQADLMRSDNGPEDWTQVVYGQHLLLRCQVYYSERHDVHVVLHSHNLIEKFFRSPVHVLTDYVETFRLPGQNVKRLRSDLGYLYEGYVQWLLSVIFGPQCSYHFNYALDGNERDAMVIAGSTVVVVEVTNHVLSLRERRSCSPLDLASVVKDDVQNAFEAARRVAHKGLLLNGSRVQAKRALPIVVIPESLPISEPLAL